MLVTRQAWLLSRLATTQGSTRNAAQSDCGKAGFQIGGVLCRMELQAKEGLPFKNVISFVDKFIYT